LKDATGTAVKASTVAITVGAPAATTTVVQTSMVNMITANWMYLAIAGSVIVVGYLYLDKKPKRR